MAAQKTLGARPCSRFATAFLGVLAIGLGSCSASVGVEEGDYTTEFNERLRPDRQFLTATQIEQRLNEGPVSTHEQPSQLVTDLYPVMEGAEKLPVADCLWVASGPGGRDLLRLHWEAILHLDPNSEAAQTVHPDDRTPDLDLGLCRLNDPVDRIPPRGRDSTTGQEPADFQDASMTEQVSDFALTLSTSGNWPRYTSDLVFLGARLKEWAALPQRPFGACPYAMSVDQPVDVFRASGAERGVRFFNGPSDEEGRVSACTPREGYEIGPERDGVRFQVSASIPGLDDPSRNHPRWLGPVVMVADGPRTIGRPTRSRDPNRGTWLTWSTGIAFPGGMRWEENFTSSLRVDSVRFFRVTAGDVPVYETTGASLCIDDPHDGREGCRWSCPGTADPQGGTRFELLSAGAACANADAVRETPQVTPTYALSNLAANDALTQPLSWGVDYVGSAELWIEFRLVSVYTPAALRLEPPLADLGAARTTSLRQGGLDVRNVGSHPMRIESVSLLSGWGSPGDFTLRLPARPQPIPIPLDFVADGQGGVNVKKGADWPELEHLLDIRDGERVTTHRPASRDGLRFSHQGEGITMRGGIKFLDRPGARLDVSLPEGTLRPLRMVAYDQRVLPFELISGESFHILVSARPQALGDRLAMVRVAARSLLDGSPAQLDAQVKVFGLQGPLADVLPPSLEFPLLNAVPARRFARYLGVINTGDQPLTVAEVTIDAGPFPTPGSFTITSGNQGGFALAPGQMDLVEVQHAPFCRPNGTTDAAQATLVVRTNAGNRIVPLAGNPTTCVP